MTSSVLMMPLIATSTLATILYIGLGFLPQPSRAAAMWSAGFMSAMVGSYVWMANVAFDAPELRGVGSGFIIAPVALMWAGLRAHRSAERSFAPLAIAYVVLMPTALWLASLTPAYDVVFRALFASTAVFAVLTIVELVRLGPHQRDESYPLIGVSAAFIVFAGVIVIDAVLRAGAAMAGQDTLEFVRTVNMIGAIVYIVCTLVTMLLLTIGGKGSVREAHGAFLQTVRGRLARADAAGDPWWSLLDIRLDDPDDIRAASSTAAFHATSDRFVSDVLGALPADADIEQLSATRVITLIPRGEGDVREILKDLLDRISTSVGDEPVPVRLSASVGWAQVQAVGYDFDELLAAAAAAAEEAQADGGDRWQVVRAAVRPSPAAG